LDSVGRSFAQSGISFCILSQRDRIWIVAYTKKVGSVRAKHAKDFIGKKWHRISKEISVERVTLGDKRGFYKKIRSTEFVRKSNDVSSRVDRIAALGNAVVPHIPEIIGRAIMESEQQDLL